MFTGGPIREQTLNTSESFEQQNAEETMQQTIRLPGRPCMTCGADAYVAVVLHPSGEPLRVMFCPTCDNRTVSSALPGELRAALDGLDGFAI